MNKDIFYKYDFYALERIYPERKFVEILEGISSLNESIKPFISNVTDLLHTSIKDDKNVVVGMLCINIDIDKLVQLKNHLDGILKLPEEIFEKTTERFSVSAEGLASDSIETILEESGISPERMSQDEKMEVVYKLDKNGVFLVKGSICKVASVLNVSNATIYRYLSKIRREV